MKRIYKLKKTYLTLQFIAQFWKNGPFTVIVLFLFKNKNMITHKLAEIQNVIFNKVCEVERIYKWPNYLKNWAMNCNVKTGLNHDLLLIKLFYVFFFFFICFLFFLNLYYYDYFVFLSAFQVVKPMKSKNVIKALIFNYRL